MHTCAPIKNARMGVSIVACITRPRTSSPFAHTLSEIDEEKKTAVCSQCGFVEIYVWQGKRKIGRRCSNASVKGVPPAQKIRREVNTNLINRYKVEHGCKRCGYNKNHLRLYLYTRNPHKNDPKIEKLLKLSRERLIQELEKSDILCAICRSLVQKEFEIDPHSDEIPLQFSHL